MSMPPREESYDTIVVGSGLGGLSAAALLANAGLRVLVVERGEGPGGYARGFQRGPYRFDPAVHVTVEASPGRTVDNLLHHLDVQERCRFVPTEHVYGAVFPGLRLRPPAGQEAFVEHHAARFPHERENLTVFFEMRARLFREMAHLPQQLAFSDLGEAMRRFPLVFRYRTATLADVLDEYLHDPRAKAVLAASWPYGGSPPSRVSFLFFSQALEVLVDHPSHCIGGFQNLVDALVFALERDNGELACGTPVDRILVDAGRVRGVRLADGRRYSAPVVVSNADATSTLTELVGVEHLPPAFLRRLRRMRPSLSGFVVYGATRRDLTSLDLAHETFLYQHWDHEQTYRDVLAGRPGGTWVSAPTLVDPSLAPSGVHLIVLSTLAPYDVGPPWAEQREGHVDAVLRHAEAVLPGLCEDLEIVETATPATLERYTRNRQGALYGWENTPDQTASKRLSHATPVDGLYLSGHWSPEGSSSFRVLVSGIAAARLVVADTGRGALVPDFKGANIAVTD